MAYSLATLGAKIGRSVFFFHTFFLARKNHSVRRPLIRLPLFCGKLSTWKRIMVTISRWKILLNFFFRMIESISSDIIIVFTSSQQEHRAAVCGRTLWEDKGETKKVLAPKLSHKYTNVAKTSSANTNIYFVAN